MLFSGSDKVKKCTVEAVGEVVEIERRLKTDSKNKSYYERYTYYPVIEYMAGDQKVRKQYSTGYDIENSPLYG